MRELRRMRPLLGTYVEVAAQGPHAAGGLRAAFDSLEGSQARWSFQSPDSELTGLNARPGEWVTVCDATLRLLRLARAMSQASGGRFDATVGGALVLDGHLPDHAGPVPLRRGEAHDLELSRSAARLRRPVRLTLDGIAKGYAIDLAVRALQSAGVRAGWVNAGGDLRVFGEALLPVWRREADGRVQPLGQLRDAALASSRVGVPSGEFPACLVGASDDSAEVITVLARRAWRADALTKVAAALPQNERAGRVAALGGHLVEAPAAVGARAMRHAA
jgi:FAD:protein FMN transferase